MNLMHVIHGLSKITCKLVWMACRYIAYSNGGLGLAGVNIENQIPMETPTFHIQYDEHPTHTSTGV